MTMTAAELVASKKHILLDFDGPVCAAFAGYGAANISRQLAMLITQGGEDVPAELFTSGDPFELLRYAATLGDSDLLADVDDEFRRLEVQAVRLAPATPGANEVLRVLSVAHEITIASNNSASAVSSYFRHNHISRYLAGISARREPDPSLLKPNPFLVLEAMQDRCASPDETILIGDSVSDIEAAKSAGVAAVGFANRPDKEARLAGSGPSALIFRMEELLLGKR